MKRMTRRNFLGTSAAAAFATTIVPAHVLGEEAPPPSAKLNVACIGVGGRGGGHLGPAASENLVALCDVDNNTLEHAAKAYPKAKKFNDYRKLFDEMGKEIDAVFVATPDHHHAFASMMAINLGKHVYCEKPLTHSVSEARKVTEAARKAKVATQMGNQGASTDGPRLLTEYIAAGAIGKVTEVHVWTDRPGRWEQKKNGERVWGPGAWWPQGCDRPTETPPVPAHINWDMWLGAAPERPYNPCYLPFKWRGWWDFGTGALGDIGCHAMSPIYKALSLKYPTAIEAESSGGTKESGPLWSIIKYEFPARGEMPPVKLIWYDGGKLPPRPEELEKDRQWGDNGTMLIGDKGKLLYDGTPRIIPEAKMKEFKRPEPTIPRIPKGDHHLDFFIACKGGRPASSNFEFAGPLAESVLAGNIAVRLGKRIEWDGPNMKATNAPEADALIRREYRKGWTL
ncbi:MAG TPA: Gfo/Idh/MocA family oxidoreductase [Planctomycetota bacterium]